MYLFSGWLLCFSASSCGVASIIFFIWYLSSSYCFSGLLLPESLLSKPGVNLNLFQTKLKWIEDEHREALFSVCLAPTVLDVTAHFLALCNLERWELEQVSLALSCGRQAWGKAVSDSQGQLRCCNRYMGHRWACCTLYGSRNWQWEECNINILRGWRTTQRAMEWYSGITQVIGNAVWPWGSWLLVTVPGLDASLLDYFLPFFCN